MYISIGGCSKSDGKVYSIEVILYLTSACQYAFNIRKRKTNLFLVITGKVASELRGNCHHAQLSLAQGLCCVIVVVFGSISERDPEIYLLCFSMLLKCVNNICI